MNVDDKKKREREEQGRLLGMRPVIRWIGDMGYTTNIEPIIIVQVDRFVIKT